jgi:hypothetical protein
MFLPLSGNPLKNGTNTQNMGQKGPPKRKKATFYINGSVIELIERAA